MNNKSKILIVDDSIANRRMLSAIFDQHTDYEILHVKSGRALLKVVERYQPDIILLDIMMPEKEQLYTDSLTKLPNRLKLIEDLKNTGKNSCLDKRKVIMPSRQDQGEH